MSECLESGSSFFCRADSLPLPGSCGNGSEGGSPFCSSAVFYDKRLFLVWERDGNDPQADDPHSENAFHGERSLPYLEDPDVLF